MEKRIANLKAMNDYICNVVGDENIWIQWITYGVPDGATADDYEYIAEDDELYNDICSLFSELTGED